MHLNSLIPLIQAKGIEKDPQIFHQYINIVFHNHEARRYDQIHKEMWESLPLQYELLINDLNKSHRQFNGLRLLDIGCGTGLSSELLLRTSLGASINEITLLDTSSEMLKTAKNRLLYRDKAVKVVEGEVQKLDGRFDVILISSVLHHIPDYTSFLKQVSALQNENGILMVIHDPLKESIESETYQFRCKQYMSYLEQNPISRSIFKRGIQKIARMLSKENYIHKVNKELISKNIIREPLTETELWSVTDIHVEGLPYSSKTGISKSNMINSLPDYQLVNFRTYGFYGMLQSNLQGKFKQLELDLIFSNDEYGRNLGSIWRKINH